MPPLSDLTYNGVPIGPDFYICCSVPFLIQGNEIELSLLLFLFISSIYPSITLRAV